MSNDDMTVYIKIDGEWRNCHSVIKSQAAEIERLRDTLDKINDLLPQHDDGDVDFVPVSVNTGSLMMEMAAIIAEARGVK